MDLYRKKGIRAFHGWTEDQFSTLLHDAEKAFHDGGQPIMTDAEYDLLLDLARKRFPSNRADFHRIGVAVERSKVRLPFPMPSLNKIKPDTGALQEWTQKHEGPYLLSCKLDGVSALYVDGKKLFTRGDGSVGQDVSALLRFLHLPKVHGECTIRGELILRKDLFREKYASEYANPRNLVSGIVNRLCHDKEDAADLCFVCYEVLEPQLPPSDQFHFLAEKGFLLPRHQIARDLSNTLLSNLLLDWRKNAEYEIDGVVVVADSIHPRTSSNPPHVFAFKMVLTDQMAETRVLAVLWSASKDGYLKPRIQIEPVVLGGVRIEYATGFNAGYIRDHRIGVGAMVRVVRSGDVIPHILEVMEPAVETMMPEHRYGWKGVDAVLEDVGVDEVLEKNLAFFFKGIGVVGLGAGNVARMMAAGYRSIPEILKMSVEDLQSVDGFQEKIAAKLHCNLREAVEKASLPLLMASSNLMGRGLSDKRLGLILDNLPDILISTDPPLTKVEKVSALRGMATLSAQNFVENIPRFLQFLSECGLEYKLQKLPSITPIIAATSRPLEGKIYVFTGVRDKELMDRLARNGATFGSSVSTKTMAVIAHNVDEDTVKLKEARRLGIPIFTPAAAAAHII
jgi:NAD-dependent DNA ligase